MEDARGKGTLAPENEIDYMKQFSRYADSGKVGEQFNGKYSPFIDVNKKLFEIGKEVGLDERTVQELFQTDESGNILKDKHGAAMFNPVMAEKHLKGKDAAKILQTFQASLTPADYNQLAITGRYQKAGLTPQQLSMEVETNYNQNIKLTDGQIQAINLQLVKENSKNNKNEALISSLTEQKKLFESQKLSLQNSKDKDMKTALSNPDAVRGSLYTNNYLSSMSRGLATSTEETTYKVNPHFEVMMRQQEFARQVQRDKISDQHWAIEQMRADKKLQYDMAKDKLEMWGKYKIGSPPEGYQGATGINEPIPVSDNKFAIIAAARDNFTQTIDHLNTTNIAITDEYFKAMVPRQAGQTDDEYEIAKNKAMDDYAAKMGMKRASAPGEMNKFAAEFAAKQLESWKKDETSVPRRFRGLIAQQNELSKSMSTQESRMADIKVKTMKKAEEQGLTVDYEKIKGKIQGTTVDTKFGNITLTPEDIIEFTKLHPEAQNTFGGFTVDERQKKEREQAAQRLTAKFGEKFKAIEDRLYNAYTPFTETSTYASTAHPAIAKAQSALASQNYEKLAEIEAQMYVDEGFIKQPKSFPIQRGKENEYDVNARLAAIASKYANDMTGFEGVSTEDVIGAIQSTKPNAVKIIATPGATMNEPVKYQMVVMVEGKQVPLMIDEGDYTYLTGNPPLRSDSKPDELIQLDHWGTTGHNGTDSSEGAWYSSSDFKNLKDVNYTATGNLVKDAANPNLLWFTIYINNPDGSVTPLEYTEPIPRYNKDGSFNQTLKILPLGVNATVIEQLKKQNK